MKYGTARQATHDNKIRHRKAALCMPDHKGKNTDTLLTFNTYYFCAATVVTRTRLSVASYLHSVSCKLCDLSFCGIFSVTFKNDFNTQINIYHSSDSRR